MRSEMQVLPNHPSSRPLHYSRFTEPGAMPANTPGNTRVHMDDHHQAVQAVINVDELDDTPNPLGHLYTDSHLSVIMGSIYYTPSVTNIDLCVICLSSLNEGPLCFTQCFHVLHQHCIDTWCLWEGSRVTTAESSGCACPVCGLNLNTGVENLDFDANPTTMHAFQTTQSQLRERFRVSCVEGGTINRPNRPLSPSSVGIRERNRYYEAHEPIARERATRYRDISRSLLPMPRCPDEEETTEQRILLNEEPPESSYWAGERSYSINRDNIHYPCAGPRGASNVYFIPIYARDHLSGLLPTATLEDLPPLPFANLPQYHESEFSTLNTWRLRDENVDRGYRNCVFLDSLERERLTSNPSRGEDTSSDVFLGDAQVGRESTLRPPELWVCVFHDPSVPASLMFSGGDSEC